MLGLQPMVSDHDATDKTPMYEMPLIFMFEVLGLGEHFLYWGFGCWHFAIGFCPEITAYGLFWAPISVLYLENPLREQGAVLSVFLETKESLSHLQWK